ncbi:MAG TPA: protein kinase [Gemmataceae bacterium]|nr:protein kinase [Gemmataceae bacterium]
MPVATPCPDLRHYQSLFSGQLAVADKEALLQHLEDCDSCVQKIQSLPGQDTLIDWIKQARTVASPPVEQQLAALMQRMIQLVQPAAGASVSATGSVVASRAAPPAGTLTFSCGSCRKPLRVKQEAAGKKVKCPHCKQVVLAPAARPAAVPEAMETAALPPASTSESATVANLPASSKEQELCAFLAPSQAPDEIGRLGSYRVLKVLGAGGMGVVFRAEDPQLQRLVALKAMLPALAANESARQRFLREARAAASLKHDHIVTIHQVGEDRGAPFLAMEFLEGEALEDRIKREGKLPLAEVLRIGREIAEGLQAAHEHGLIHRDIKPANVWLEGKRGRVKILDFGLARSSSDDVHLTQSGAIVGTPAYMPPEQARGDAVDARCDLYSLGCVLFRLCTGELPFKGDNTMSLLLALATEQPKSPREINADVPPPLADLILRLLAKEPSQRPAMAGDVAQSLQDIAVEKSPARAAASTLAPPRRRRKLLWAAAAGALLVAALLTVIVIRLGRPEDGTVTIETVDPNVELVFTGGGRDYTVRDKKTGDEIKLPLGSYEVALKDGKDGLKLVTNQFTLERGGRAIVKVTRQPGTPLRRADLPPPVQVPEPPPLEEWLKGRKVLTVAQDGKGQFKTIQAALEALKPHQVVKVLDRGPYRETLRLKAVPEDTGLISEQNTIVELPKWEPDPQLPDVDFGHHFESVDGFRLSGFRFLAPPNKRFCYLTRWDTCPAGLVIEDCCFDPQEVLDPWPLSQPIILRFAGPRFIKAPVVVRRCAVYGGSLHIEENHDRAVVLIENNYFHKAGCIYCGSPRLQKLIIRHNVFDYEGPIFQKLEGNATFLELSNNTSTHMGAACLGSVPTGGVTVCNNILKYGFAFNTKFGAAQHRQAAKGWRIGHNCYLDYAKLLEPVVPKAATDLVEDAEFLSLNPESPDYLRLPSDSPAAKGGAGGAWPSYIGALPPGPAPKDGDWFTRLRQRWDNVAPAAKPVSPPTQIPESPPLAEWLKGRKILTVSQDGTGQFKTIQAALEALKPHQVVKVLDRGPYREPLRAGAMPPDTGLISDRQTVIELTKIPSSPGHGHIFESFTGFRLSGFRFLAPAQVEFYSLFCVNQPAGLVIEDCFFGGIGDKVSGAAAAVWLAWHRKEPGLKPVVVRNCLFDYRGGLLVAGLVEGEGEVPVVLVEHNYFLRCDLVVTVKHARKLVVRHNVFLPHSSSAWIGGLCAVDETLEISNNTSVTSGITFAQSAPRQRVVIRNNLMARGLDLDAKAAKIGLGNRAWQVDHNGCIRRGVYPPAATDVFEDPPFLSKDPAHPDYLRLPADSASAKGGVGGAWPSYIGAFPPGPAPKEGDWFTRLREKWMKDKPSAKK